MAKSVGMKVILWALFVTLTTCVMADEIVRSEIGVAVKVDETDDSSSNARRAVYTGNAGFSGADKADIVNRHNSLRSQRNAANMLHMEWNPALENLAQNWANRCVFEHSSNQERSNVGGFGYVGENIYATTGQFEPAGVIQSWYDEVKDYNYNNGGCNNGAQCGHYTQIVWANSRAVGCGVKHCGNLGGVNFQNAYFIVCNYGPGGNYVGQKPYNLGAVCSQCPADRRHCVNGLCAPN